MRYLSLQEAQILHDDIIDEIGGLKDINSQQIGLLESALVQIQNDEYYPHFLDKLTHLFFACVKFHPFLDGNKRTTIYLAKAFIKLNYAELLPDDFYQNLEDIVVSVAEGKITEEQLREILKNLLGL